MRSTALDVAELLHNEGIGNVNTTSGWRLLVGKEQAQQAGMIPHTTITVYDLPGAAPDYRPGIDRPAIQVRVRGAPTMASYPATYQKAREIRAFLLGAVGVEIGGAVYVLWEAESEPAQLPSGTDDNERPIVIATYVAHREPVTGS